MLNQFDFLGRNSEVAETTNMPILYASALWNAFKLSVVQGGLNYEIHLIVSGRNSEVAETTNMPIWYASALWNAFKLSVVQGGLNYEILLIISGRNRETADPEFGS